MGKYKNWILSVSKLNGSKGIWFIITNDAKIEMPYRIESHVSSLSVFIFFIFSLRDKNTPLTPKPSSATLMTMKAKWYQSETDNIRVRVNSNRRVLSAVRKIPVKYIDLKLFCFAKKMYLILFVSEPFQYHVF